MALVYLVRHGETDWNRSGQIMGTRPIPLNERGRAQARKLGMLMEGVKIGRIVTSPVARAVQTAEILQETLRAPLHHDPGLAEVSVGDWEGKFWDDLVDDDARTNFYRRPDVTRPPGGETLQEVQARAVSALTRALGPETVPVLLVSHADVIRTLLAHCLGLALDQVRYMRIAHTTLSALALHDTSADLLYLNYPSELSGH